MTIDQIFQKHFAEIGDGVRDEQRVVIESLLAGHNTLSIMPTGGGKSLIYWIAGLGLGGTTLALFPLTALMDEQAQKLETHGLDVLTLHSGISTSQQQKKLMAMRNGKMPDFIFVSPERIGNDGFLEYILSEKREAIKLVVIDEIHCISQWGHDFRPFYLEIPPFLDGVFGNHKNWPVILGLTATLNQKDTQEVCQDFHIEPDHVLKSQYLLRYPIDIQIAKVDDDIEKDKLFWQFLESHRQEKILVYIENRRSGDRSTEGMATKAQDLGYKAAYFHGSMTSKQKADVIKRYKASDVLLVFATSAFGMGIDIPDIRGVIHYRPPESIEQFYQQIGRVGRDGLPAWAMCYYSDKNISFRKSYFIDRSFPTEQEIQDTFTSLISGRGKIQTFNYFSEESMQTAYHYLLRSGAVRVLGKGIGKIDIFEKAPGVEIPKFEQYRRTTRTGGVILTAKKVDEPVKQVVQNIYRWWAKGKIRTDRSPQKCLIVEQVADQLPLEKLNEILADIEEKRAYRYGLLDQLAELLDGFSNSISLHQEIGKYLGVDKFQMGRVHQTESGEMVRSKSEVIIADQLTHHTIPFEYEKRLEAGGFGFMPDFTIQVSGKTYYWEHLGRLDLEQYRQNWVIKENWYMKHFPGQLVTTKEGSTVSQAADTLIHFLVSGKKTEQQDSSDNDLQSERQTPDSVFGSGGQKYRVQLWPEGRTDWKHLKAAFQRLKAEGQFTNLEIDFQEDEDDMGDKELLAMCRTYSRTEHSEPVICVFDRDLPNTLKHVTDKGKDYKDWGNHVYSVALPVPEFRKETPGICIEFCYLDEAIQQKDENGRRLFVGLEFSNRSGIHNNREFTCSDRNKTGKFTIIDNQVFRIDDQDEENIALSKNQFANYILNGHPGFDNFDISGFLPLFELIEKIAIAEASDTFDDIEW